MMRPTQVAAIGVVLLSANVDAAGGQTAAGVVFGWSTSSVVWRSSGFFGSSNQNRNAYGLAATLRVRAPRRISYETGLSITAKGFNRTQPTYHPLYAEFPFRMVAQAGGPGSSFRPFFMGGLTVAWMVYCRRFFDSVSGFLEDHCNTAIAPEIDQLPLRRWDAGLDVGFGFRTGGAEGGLLGVVRMNRGLIDMEPHRHGESTLNLVTTVMLGVEWPIGGSSTP